MSSIPEGVKKILEFGPKYGIGGTVTGRVSCKEPNMSHEGNKDRTEAGGRVTTAVSMLHFFEDQREWSYATFGPPSFKGPKGPINHLAIEVKEVLAETDDEKRKMELVDCLFLTFDAMHRAGMTFDEVVELAHKKLAINKSRTWPAWQGTNPDNPIEHDRSHD